MIPSTAFFLLSILSFTTANPILARQADSSVTLSDDTSPVTCYTIGTTATNATLIPFVNQACGKFSYATSATDSSIPQGEQKQLFPIAKTSTTVYIKAAFATTNNVDFDEFAAANQASQAGCMTAMEAILAGTEDGGCVAANMMTQGGVFDGTKGVKYFIDPQGPSGI
ncbi:MAG: hypothetical protein M1827_004789 [Pycnora praestabilis]|nr:MAG: hypothetical protein M1827_004789 [Pycnora praestabilis]